MGYIIRNDNAKEVLMGAKGCGIASILVAEALTLKEGVKAVIFLGCKNLEIEGDNICVLNCLKGIWPIPWQISSIIYYIKQNLSSFENIKINHQLRQANLVADFSLRRATHVLLTLDGSRVFLANYRFSTERMS